MASLIDWLATAGHRKGDGTANASGKLFCLNPGSNATQVVFADADETQTLTQPIALDAAGKATVYAAGPLDLLFEDSAGATLATVLLGNVVADARVSVDPAAFTGPYLSDVGLAALSSFGDLDFKYKESSGATSRKVGEWLAGVQLSVKDFGAKGDGLTIDTTAIQLAINRCAARGGGRVYLDPGTYLTDATISLPANVSLIGAGSAVSKIKLTNGVVNALLVSAGGIGNNTIQGIQIMHSSTSTGFAISCLSTSRIVIRDVLIGTDLFFMGVVFDACSTTAIYDSFIFGHDTGAGTGRGVLYKTSGRTGLIVNTSLGATLTGKCVEYATGGSDFSIFGSTFTVGAVGVVLTSSDNNDMIRVIGCAGLAQNVGAPFSEVSPASQTLYQVGNLIDGYTIDLTSGSTFTPDPFLKGENIRVRGTTTGVAYVVAAPATNPVGRRARMTIQFFNNAGGAVTGWTLNAIYKVTGAISVNNLDKTMIEFVWDSSALAWRELARAVTT